MKRILGRLLPLKKRLTFAQMKKRKERIKRRKEKREKENKK